MEVEQGPFLSQQIAEAFCAGVTYVNDSACKVVGKPVRKAGGWFVTILDEDRKPEEDA